MQETQYMVPFIKHAQSRQNYRQMPCQWVPGGQGTGLMTAGQEDTIWGEKTRFSLSHGAYTPADIYQNWINCIPKKG